MCGIVGIIGPSDNGVDAKLMRSLLIMDVVRGKDSTGVFSVDKRGVAMWYKRAILPSEIFEHKGYKDVQAHAVGGMGWIGHNRAATQGAVNSDNAHPFHHSPITGVHNGTLFTDTIIPNPYGTDSEAIFKSISECKTDKEVEELIESLDGAFALVWFNSSNNKWYVTRNDDRPLHYAEIEHKGVTQFLISSEKEILYAAGVRSGFNFELDDIKEFEIARLYTFEVSLTNKTSTIKMTVGDKLTLTDWGSYYGKGGWNYNANSYVGNNNSYATPAGYLAQLGIQSGWYSGQLLGMEHVGKTGLGTIHGKVRINNTDYEFRLYGKREPQGKFEVYISGYNQYAHQNQSREEKGLPLVLSASDITEALDDFPFRDGSLMECINCMNMCFGEEQRIKLEDDLCICETCYETDPHVEHLLLEYRQVN